MNRGFCYSDEENGARQMKREKCSFTGVVISVLMGAFALTCIFIVVHILAVSLSGKGPVTAGSVILFPVECNLESYEYILKQQAFWKAMGTTILRCAVGMSINFVLTVLTAYPLSRSQREFRIRTFYVWFMFITTIFSGGLVAYYVLIYNVLQINNTIWALVLPTALPVFNVVLMINFFRDVPKELEEAAVMDGAGHFRILFSLYIPLSKPALATVTLYTFVSHWNSWFDGLIYMDFTEKYPLATFLQRVIVANDSSAMRTIVDLTQISERSTRSAQIFLAMLPILLFFPFVQKYFTQGIMVGGIKG